MEGGAGDGLGDIVPIGSLRPGGNGSGTHTRRMAVSGVIVARQKSRRFVSKVDGRVKVVAALTGSFVRSGSDCK